MNKELRLGSLFDGSGGFPLAAIFCEIKPIWASEVEPFPIRVTQKNLPQIKHLGDIKDIDGYGIEPVDIISFGSPCQDLSIAGKRAGLEGEKSNLFYEATRVIKEMRCKTNVSIQDTYYGKMCQEPSHLTKERILDASLKKLQELKIPQLNFLDLRGGKVQEKSWETIFPLLGESLMLNTLEYPNEGEESSLSQILMEEVPEKYYLSKKACQGILHRAARKGKEIPEPLKKALIEQSV